MLFERKVIRKIFGPKKERDGAWRIKKNNVLDELIRHKNIINHTKAQRLSWFGHLQGGSNMTGTDLCVNKPHRAAAVRP